MGALTAEQAEVLYENNENLKARLELMTKDRNHFKEEYVERDLEVHRLRAVIEGYKRAFMDLKAFDMESAPKDGTEFLAISSKLRVKKTRWLKEIAMPRWGGKMEHNQYWTYPDEDQPSHWLPINYQKYWKPMCCAPKDGTSFIATLRDLDADDPDREYFIVSWCKNMKGNEGFWPTYENYFEYTEDKHSWDNYYWLPIPIFIKGPDEDGDYD